YVRAGLELAVLAEVAAGGQAGAVDRQQPGTEVAWVGVLARVELGGDVPVRRGDELPPLALAVHHDPGGHRLHATGGQPAGDLLPQDRADLVAVQPVEDAPGLLGVDEVLVERPRVLRGGADGRL